MLAAVLHIQLRPHDLGGLDLLQDALFPQVLSLPHRRRQLQLLHLGLRRGRSGMLKIFLSFHCLRV